NGPVEMYDGLTKEGKPGGRYLTITGHHLKGTPTKIRRRPKAIAEVYDRELRPHPQAVDPQPMGQLQVLNPDSEALDDDALIAKAMEDETFKRLFEGDISATPGKDKSHSGADFVLCIFLAYLTGYDAERIDRLFRRSGLMRDKWNRKDYREQTIAKAIVCCVSHASRRGRRRNDSEHRLPFVFVDTDEHRVNEEVAKALARDPDLYQRGNILVRIVKDQSPAAKQIRRPLMTRIEALPASILRERLPANAVLLKQEGKRAAPVHPPAWCVAALMDRGQWPGVRHLEGVLNHPVLRPDGTILSEPGYD